MIAGNEKIITNVNVEKKILKYIQFHISWR